MTETPFTFDPDLKTIDERTIWLSQYADSRPHQLFVASHDGALLGYAESGQFREKRAYETSVETTIYLHSDAKHKGVGILLYAPCSERYRHRMRIERTLASRYRIRPLSRYMRNSELNHSAFTESSAANSASIGMLSSSRTA